MRKKLLSLFLVACMVLPMIPVMALTALATEGDGTYSTNFSADPTNPNFPTLDLPLADENTTHDIGGHYAYNDVAKDTYISDLVTFNGNWEVGAFPVEWNSTTGAVTVKAGFSPYRVIRRDRENDISLNDAFGSWGSHTDGRGGALFMDSLLEWVLSFGMNYGSSGDRYVKNYYSTSGIRYIAEYTGTIDITAALAFFAANGADVAILHNTEVVAVIENDGTAVKPNDGSNVDFGEVVSDLAVRTGDVIAFVNIGDSTYDQDVAGFNYNNTKRGFRNFDFTITYEEGYYEEEVEIWDGLSNANIVRNATGHTDPNLYFFAWYQANGTRIAATATGKLNADCYAVVNPYLIENEIVAEDDTYAVAMEKYRAYLKSQTYIAYNGNWSFGANSKGVYSAFAYPSYLDRKNPYMVRTSGAGNVVSEFAISRWISETNFDKIFDSFYAASWQGNTTKNPTIPQEDTLLRDIRLSYTTDLHPSGSQGNGMAYAPTTNEAVAGVEGRCYSAADIANVFYARPGNNNTSVSNMLAGSFAYTAAKAGVLELKVNAVKFLSDNKETTQNLDTQWALFINGVPKTDFATVDNKNGNNPADAINAKLAEVGEIPVCKGDIVEIVFLRGPSGGVHVNMSITSVMDDSRVPVIYKSGNTILQTTVVKKGEALPALVGHENFGSSGYIINGVFATELPATVTEDLVIEDFYIPSSVSLTIAGNFAINVYVAGGDDVTAAGVLVNGEELAGVLQEDGSYKVTLLKVAAKDLLTATASYQAYQYKGETRSASNAVTTVTAAGLLDAYKATDMPVVTQNLAQAVANYAHMADIVLNNGVLSDNDPVKNQLKGPNTIVDNYDSGAYDVLLATIKMYSVAGYTPEYHPDRYPGTSHTFVPDASVTEADKVVWGFGEQNPTDAAFKFAINGITLNLEDTIGFALRIQANGETAIKELKAENKYKVKVTMGEDVAYYDTFFYVDETLTEKALVVEGISAAACSDDYTFTVVQETEDGYVDVSATLTYSINAWCVNQFNFAEGTPFAYLVRAIYRLGLAADAYAAL